MTVKITYSTVDPLTGTLKLHRNGPLYSDTVIGAPAVDGLAVTCCTVRRASSLYQMQQPTHQRPVYQLHIIRCGTTSPTKGLTRANRCCVLYLVI